MIQVFNPGTEKARINVFVKHRCTTGTKQPIFRKDEKYIRYVCCKLQANSSYKQTEIQQ